MNTTVGQLLRQAREKRQVTLEQAVKATHIRLHYLQALEADMFDSLPSTTQAKGFLRIYASFLDLDPDILLSSIENQNANIPLPASQPDDVPTPSASSKFAQADKIFAEIGQTLRDQRELLGLSLEEVEKHTHLRLHYLRALESGDLEALPSPVQGRGMLNNYATFLGMDADQLLLRFAEGLQARLSVKQAEAPQKEAPPEKSQPILPPKLRRFFSSEILIGGMVIAGLILSVLWGGDPGLFPALRTGTHRNGAFHLRYPPSILDAYTNRNARTGDAHPPVLPGSLPHSSAGNRCRNW